MRSSQFCIGKIIPSSRCLVPIKSRSWSAGAQVRFTSRGTKQSNFTSKKPPNPQLAITKKSLRDALENIDPGDPIQENNFIDLLRSSCENIKHETVPLGSLSEVGVIKSFFKNNTPEEIGIEVVEYPGIEVKGADIENESFRWVEDALMRVGKTWHTHGSKSNCRVSIEIIMTGFLYEFQRKAELAPKRLPRLKAFGEVTLKELSIDEEKHGSFLLSGRPDLAIGYESTEKGKPNPIDTFLAIVEAKKQGIFDSAFTQLLVYMGIIHQERIRQKKNATVYGICTDGTRYIFARVDNDSIVSRSIVYNILLNRPHVYAFIWQILKAAQQNSPQKF